MQFLLTKEEYSKLVDMAQQRSVTDIETIQRLCTFVADNVPVTISPTMAPQPLGCILTESSDNYNGYCGDCIVVRDCPSKYRRFSK